ncbi:hypothetical protein F4808DRAFT_461288 [Astrocystis sublimbata]|nr:hypothetical protein F4808DRAFT_461288 [Astrocystis sublimbata]
MLPVSPPLGSLRLANIHDVPRIAAVATSGFYYSPVFTWDRPYHRHYPQDTFKSYEKMFADAIRNPEHIALVAEDSYDPDERAKSYAIIKPDAQMPIPEAGSQVIVGVATWKLEPKSQRYGQFMDPNDSPDIDYSGGLERDKNTWRIDQLDTACDFAEQKYLDGYQMMDMLVVHPAYWRRGHGSSLTKWGMALADRDHVNQGVVAAGMGKQLFLKLNYSRLAEVHARDNKNPAEIAVGILEYCLLPIGEGWRLEM